MALSCSSFVQSGPFVTMARRSPSFMSKATRGAFGSVVGVGVVIGVSRLGDELGAASLPHRRRAVVGAGVVAGGWGVVGRAAGEHLQGERGDAPQEEGIVAAGGLNRRTGAVVH